MAPSPNLLLPIKLDAFILNPSVCNGGRHDSKIAPITQPNYTYLRIDQKAARTDVLSHVDLHLSSPSTRNPRITNLSTRQPRPERQGVYLHWTIPKLYRSGVASAAQDETSNAVNDGQATGPTFPLVPNRWMVVRRLRANTLAPSDTTIPLTEAWIVESDTRHRIDELGQEVDLQTDVSPFMDVGLRSRDDKGNVKLPAGAHGKPEDIGNVSIADQAEIFIARKWKVSEWEGEKRAQDKKNVNLHVLASSNPLFADYQPHNSNVFSILDTFSYNEVKDENGITKCDRLTKATADYYVMGWHSSTKDDILFSQAGKTRRERLEKLSLLLSEGLVDSKAWLDDSAAARIICHGAMYQVNWDATVKPRTPADEWSLNLNQKQQVSVGTSPIDALLAYVSAHHGDQPADPQDESTKLIRQLEQDIWNLRAYLRMQENTSVDAYRKATDALMHVNFSRSSGGKRFTFPINTKGPTKPDDNHTTKLLALNRAQSLLEASLRTLKRRRWELFSLWFKHFSTADSAIQATPKDVQDAHDRFDELVAVISQQTKAVQEAKKDVANAVEAVHPEYYQQGDPTIMVSGVKSGWAHDFLQKAKVRIDSHTVQPSAEASSTLDMSRLENAKIPTDVWESMVKLLGEFCALSDNDEHSTKDNQMPLYHDTGLEDKDPQANTGPGMEGPLWRDRWNNRQPWFPLFVEWEAEYVHVPWEAWVLQKPFSASSGHERTSYRIDPATDLTNIKDTRLISGRILILPQPSFALNALIDQLFNTIPEDELNSIISHKERENLSKNVLRLPFLSAPLSGLTDHLITLAQGTHIKPSVRASGQEAPQPVAEAVDKAGPGMDPMFPKSRIERMGLELDPTPYGAQIHVAADGDSPSPFKPVTHGQLRFTKLNVIDKFGQAIHALQPRTSSVAGPIEDGLAPCVGEFYEVSKKATPPAGDEPAAASPTTTTATVEAHTAGKDDVNGLSEFIQLPPSINQPARLNAHFVKRESRSDPHSGWRPTTEWEDDHIWGWIVVNYIDYGIQLFTAKGIFYREVRLPGSGSGRTAGVAGAKWLPFKKTEQPEGATAQLDKLISQLTAEDGVYLQAFIDMINGALKQSGPPPGEYAEALNCIVGKPLALVNMGWSLELSMPPSQNQSTINSKDPERRLLDSGGGSGADSGSYYRFPVKLGDSHREYDGLVGYFPVKDRIRSPSSGPQDPGALPLNDEFDLTKLYTYFGLDGKPAEPDRTPSYPLLDLDNSSYPRFAPHWLNPADYKATLTNPLTDDEPSPEDAARIAAANARYLRDENAFLQVFAAVIDPFQAVHGYSSFLPIKELKLLDWTWQQALNNMTAFFHMGPLMVAKDVPPEFNPEFELRADLSLNGEQPIYEKLTVDVLPTGVDEWNWLQPYFVNDPEPKPQPNSPAGAVASQQGSQVTSDGNTGGDDDVLDKTKFMPIKVGRMDTRPRFEKGPYTAIEGYLQMKKSIIDTSDEKDKKKKKQEEVKR